MKNLIIFIVLIIGLVPQTYAASEKAIFEKGVALMKQEKFQDAIDVFSELMIFVPNNPAVYRHLGVAHMKLSEYDLAIQNLETARKIKPDLKGLYSNLGVAWYYKGDYSRAIKYYNMEIAQTQDNYYAYFNRAICRSKLGEVELSLDDVTKSLEIFPNFYRAQCLKGDLLAKNGTSLKAKRAYERAMAIDPDHSYAKDQLASLKFNEAKLPLTTDPPAVAQIFKQAHPPVKSMIIENKTAKQKLKKAEQSMSDPKKNDEYELQAGAFLSKNNADKLYKKFIDEGYPVKVVKLTRPSGQAWHLVRIGHFETKAAAKADQIKVKKHMAMDLVVRPYGRF